VTAWLISTSVAAAYDTAGGSEEEEHCSDDEQDDPDGPRIEIFSRNPSSNRISPRMSNGVSFVSRPTRAVSSVGDNSGAHRRRTSIHLKRTMTLSRLPVTNSTLDCDTRSARLHPCYLIVTRRRANVRNWLSLYVSPGDLLGPVA